MKSDHGNQSNYTQWFYFKVSNMRKDQEYVFHIVNFVKPDSLYNTGMKPLIYSCKEAEVSGVGWQRIGKDIAYYPSQSIKLKANP